MATKWTDADRAYMARALQLAANGRLHASPNPMVGAVIVAPDGRMIGEGWHRRCGEGHAEVNAVASVSEADRALLKESTMYVTLEPCSHYGKTPPCAELIIREGIPRVEVAVLDPFVKVSGRGVEMLREAGVKVGVGLLEEDARNLNRRFFTAHTERRPFVTLKWAESADGFLDGRDSPSDPPAMISNAVTRTAAHRLRAEHDAILIGSGTLEADNPTLTVRHYAGESPRRIVVSSRPDFEAPEGFEVRQLGDIESFMAELYADGITSVLVEGGAGMLRTCLLHGYWDALRREVNPRLSLGQKQFAVAAPAADVAWQPSMLHNNLIFTCVR